MRHLSFLILITVFFLSLGCHKKEDPINLIFDGFLNVSSSNASLGTLANDLKGKEIINGNVSIKNYGNNFLSFLKNIKTINGDLDISETTITDLDFLSSLETVTGRILISINANFNSTKGLENLKKVGGLSIYGQNKPIDLFHIQNVSVSDNFNLQYIANDSFPFFKNVINLSSYLIIGNTNIKDLKCLSNLKTVGSTIEIRSNKNLSNFEGFNQLESVNGSFNISFNENIVSLRGLDNLTTVKKEFYIDGLRLKSIANLIKLTTVESLVLLGTQCESLEGLQNVSFAKSVHIRANSKLSNLCALKPLLEMPIILNRFFIEDNLQNPTPALIKANCK